MNENSIYHIISVQIVAAREDQKAVVQTDKIVDRTLLDADMSDISREGLERKYVKALTAVCLYQHGYRSVLPGYGYYINWDDCTNPIYMQKLLENAEQNEEVKKIIRESIQKNVFQKYAQRLMKVPRGQMRMSENGELFTEPTFEELLEMLETDEKGRE